MMRLGAVGHLFAPFGKNGHLKPVVSKGWRAFVRAKGLKPGDKVTFYLKISEDGIRVFGSIFPRSCYSIEVERA
ncbi:hypothetical protein REPUB_Repub10bG0026700 [Reevesia pubescens]